MEFQHFFKVFLVEQDRFFSENVLKEVSYLHLGMVQYSTLNSFYSTIWPDCLDKIYLKIIEEVEKNYIKFEQS